MNKLDVNSKVLNLEGVSLVEAGAGSGKTYSITKIVLRAILDNYKISDILLVTFTEAAVKELRSRLRKELSEFYKVLISGNIKHSEVYKDFPVESNKEVINKVKAALLDVDIAPVFTIHGFCKRMLTENAFESKISFNNELKTDLSDIYRDIAANFWRRYFVKLANNQTFVPDLKFNDILKLVTQFLSIQDDIIPENYLDVKDLKLYIVSLYNDKQKYISVLKNNPDSEIFAFFKENPGLLKQDYSKKLDKNIADLITCLEQESIGNVINIFTQETINKNCFLARKKIENIEPPQHDFFKLCSKLENLKSVINYSLYKFAVEEFKDIKIKQNILSFNDLIKHLYMVLKAEEKLKFKPLTDLIRKKFKIAFVDEFQDTDNMQYEIFHLLFGDNGQTSQGYGLFMIGDPKQSIYKFRGADVHSYLKAKEVAKYKYSLAYNFRSERKMIKAVNALFQNKETVLNTEDFEIQESTNNKVDNIFVYKDEAGKEGIKFFPAEVPDVVNKKYLHTSSDTANLELWKVPAANTKYLERSIAMHIANEIISLVSDGTHYIQTEHEKQNINFEDIAILVNENSQALIIKDIFTKANIPAVIQNSGNVFKSNQAFELGLWLKAILNPVEFNIRKLFITDLLKKNAEEILNISETDLFDFSEFFIALSANWHKQGFYASFSFFIKKYDVIAKNLSSPSGERIITNFMHLADLLNQFEIQNGRNIEDTMMFLLDKNQNGNIDDDDYLEILESDRNAVKIMTVHKSKGLEFPIVFCPFFWKMNIDRGEKNQKIIIYKSNEKGHLVTKINFAYNKEDFYEIQLKQRVETLAEHVRLFYVALTRSKHRSYLIIGDTNTTGKSLLPFVFSPSVPVDFVNTITGKGSKEQLKQNNQCCFGGIDSFYTRNSEYVSYKEKDFIFTPKVFVNNIEESKSQDFSVKVINEEYFKQSWGMTSFSALIKSHKFISDNAEKGNGVFSLPRGKQFGTAVHKVFENYFKIGKQVFDSSQQIRLWAFEALMNKFNIELDIAEKMFFDCLNNPMTCNNQNIILSDISLDDLKPEFAFFHKINNLSPLLLKKIFTDFSNLKCYDFEMELENLGFSFKKGYIHGEIDLLFRVNNRYYVLDWKTNNLGNSFEHYTPKCIKNNMQKHLYFLQAHIYSFAVHLFLQQRFKEYRYDENFGGFIYVYTRGVDLCGNGYYHHKPDIEFIKAMEKFVLNTNNKASLN